MVGLFYKAIVQSVSLHGCETWVITPQMMQVLASFHNKCARRIAGMMPYLVDGQWVYPDVQKARKKAGLHSMEHYIRKRQNAIVQCIATRPIHDLWLAVEPPPEEGAPRSSRLFRWWTQPTRTTEAPEEADIEADSSTDSDVARFLAEMALWEDTSSSSSSGSSAGSVGGCLLYTSPSPRD